MLATIDNETIALSATTRKRLDHDEENIANETWTRTRTRPCTRLGIGVGKS